MGLDRAAEPLFSRDELGEILELATRLDAADVADADPAITLAELHQIGAELGIGEASIERAAAEWRATRAHHVAGRPADARSGHGWSRWLVSVAAVGATAWALVYGSSGGDPAGTVGWAIVAGVLAAGAVVLAVVRRPPSAAGESPRLPPRTGSRHGP